MMKSLKDAIKGCKLFGLFGWDLLVLSWFFIRDGVKEFWGLANITPQKQVIGGLCILTIAILAVQYPQALWLLALAPVAFIQNMFFTLVSRSRNSQDTDYHRFCAWGSNGVWFICQVMIVKNIWTAIMAGQWWYAILAGVVYSLATTEGSVLMMKRLIKTEKGKRRVGANDKIDALEKRIDDLENGTPPRILGMTMPILPINMPLVDAIGKDKIPAPTDALHVPFLRFDDPEYGKKVKDDD